MEKQTIKVNELKSIGYEELYFECFECPKCPTKGLSEDDSYCRGCGVKIEKELENL